MIDKTGDSIGTRGKFVKMLKNLPSWQERSKKSSGKDPSFTVKVCEQNVEDLHRLSWVSILKLIPWGAWKFPNGYAPKWTGIFYSTKNTCVHLRAISSRDWAMSSSSASLIHLEQYIYQPNLYAKSLLVIDNTNSCDGKF